MKLFNNVLLALSFMITTSIMCMNPTGTRVEETSNNSDIVSESELEPLALLINETGKFGLYFNARAINKSIENETLLIGIKINNINAVEPKKFLIKGNSTATINGHFAVEVKKDDWVELQFNAPLTVDVDVNTSEIDLIDLELIEPKTKL
jgi:hypothetical protein